jgi:hypothetical protein
VEIVRKKSPLTICWRKKLREDALLLKRANRNKDENLLLNGMMVCFYGRLSRNKSYYEDQVLLHGGFVSKSGYGAQIGVIPNSKNPKETTRYKKFTRSSSGTLRIIRERDFVRIVERTDLGILDSIRTKERKGNTRSNTRTVTVDLFRQVVMAFDVCKSQGMLSVPPLHDSEEKLRV